MNLESWSKIDSKNQELVISICSMAGFDFKSECLSQSAEIKEYTSPWIKRKEAADLAKCSTDTIDKWLRNNYIQGFKMSSGRPGAVLIDIDSLIQYIKSRKINIKKRKRGYRVSKRG